MAGNFLLAMISAIISSNVINFVRRSIGHKNTKANIFRIQADNYIMCGYFSVGFLDFMSAGKNLIDFSSLFSLYDFKKSDDIILSYFKK